MTVSERFRTRNMNSSVVESQDEDLIVYHNISNQTFLDLKKKRDEFIDESCKLVISTGLGVDPKDIATEYSNLINEEFNDFWLLFLSDDLLNHYSTILSPKDSSSGKIRESLVAISSAIERKRSLQRKIENLINEKVIEQLNVIQCAKNNEELSSETCENLNTSNGIEEKHNIINVRNAPILYYDVPSELFETISDFKYNIQRSLNANDPYYKIQIYYGLILLIHERMKSNKYAIGKSNEEIASFLVNNNVFYENLSFHTFAEVVKFEFENPVEYNNASLCNFTNAIQSFLYDTQIMPQDIPYGIKLKLINFDEEYTEEKILEIAIKFISCSLCLLYPDFNVSLFAGATYENHELCALMKIRVPLILFNIVMDLLISIIRVNSFGYFIPCKLDEYFIDCNMEITNRVKETFTQIEQQLIFQQEDSPMNLWNFCLC